MIELVGDLPAGVAGFRLSGHISRDDYKQVVLPLMKESLAQAGGVRLLVVIDGDFDRFEAGALWEDMKFGLGSGVTHLSKWERMALVSDADWARHAISLFGWMVPGDVRVFPLAEQGDAVTWLAAKD